MGPMEPERIQVRYTAQMKVPVWVIYEKPPEQPNDFVLRCFVEDKPLDQIAVCGTLPVAKSYLPAGVKQLGEAFSTAYDGGTVVAVYI